MRGRYPPEHKEEFIGTLALALLLAAAGCESGPRSSAGRPTSEGDSI